VTARWLKRLMNCWPVFIGAGIRVRHIADDWSEAVVEMPLRWYNRNYVRTQFGGSLYAMTDPFHMLLAMHRLGRDYIVWDKAGSIEYVAPGRGKVSTRIAIDDARIDDIRDRARSGAKVLPEFAADVVDETGAVVARVSKTLYVRLKKPAQ
jgi:hypothetical protein